MTTSFYGRFSIFPLYSNLVIRPPWDHLCIKTFLVLVQGVLKFYCMSGYEIRLVSTFEYFFLILALNLSCNENRGRQRSFKKSLHQKRWLLNRLFYFLTCFVLNVERKSYSPVSCASISCNFLEPVSPWQPFFTFLMTAASFRFHTKRRSKVIHSAWKLHDTDSFTRRQGI